MFEMMRFHICKTVRSYRIYEKNRTFKYRLAVYRTGR